LAVINRPLTSGARTNFRRKVRAIGKDIQRQREGHHRTMQALEIIKRDCLQLGDSVTSQQHRSGQSRYTSELSQSIEHAAPDCGTATLRVK
jgi:hypothetical protein